MLSVVNTHHVGHLTKDTLYIGREYWKKHDWGTMVFPTYVFANPFKIGVDGTREQVLTKYKHWIARELIKAYNIFKRQGRVTRKLLEIQTLAEYYKKEGHFYLRCYCHPKVCHGDVLISLARKLSQMELVDFIEYLKVKISRKKVA